MLQDNKDDGAYLPQLSCTNEEAREQRFREMETLESLLGLVPPRFVLDSDESAATIFFAASAAAAAARCGFGLTGALMCLLGGDRTSCMMKGPVLQ